MSRLILLCGTGGAGTSTIADATAAAIRDEGLDVALIRAADPPGPPESAAVSEPLGRVFREIGADDVVPEAWWTLPGLDSLAALVRATQALADGRPVVIDAGTHREARTLVQLPGVLLRLLDAALTPRLAMWRGPGGSDVAFDALSAARIAVLDLVSLLGRETTTVRLVAEPTMASVERTVIAMSVMSMLGVGVEGAVVNRYPRSSEAGSKKRRPAQQALAALQQAAGGIAVWKSTAKLRPVPKGRSALGPLGPVHVLDAEQLTVTVEDDESLGLDLHLMPYARTSARVGTHEDHLVLGLDSTYRWIDLPPVLRRCAAEAATRTPDGVRVRFRPDPSLWRPSAAAGEVAS